MRRDEIGTMPTKTYLGCKLKVRPLHDCIYRASFLAEAAVNAFGHVNIISASHQSEGMQIDIHCEIHRQELTTATR